ncbi:MAG TPA: hypothetical protein VIJ88_01425 [Candidatus Paceibacterota bacterium]
MFGKKHSGEQNVILLDVENASVGVALVHLAEGSAPVLFAEQRTLLALPRTLQSDSIAKQIEAAAHEALLQLSLVAARLRINDKTTERGAFTNAAVFLGAPWGVPNLALGKAGFSPHMQNFLTTEIEAVAQDLPLSFYTSADSATYGSRFLPTDCIVLVAILRGEITELILLGESGALGYATVPIGFRSVYRTLQTHAGLSLAEIPAVLALAKHPVDSPYYEPLEAVGRHMVEFFAPGVEALIHNGVPQSLLIIADEPLGSWFARTLEGDSSLETLFASGSTMRTLGSHTLVAHLAGHAATPDLHLTLGALFVHGKHLGASAGI